MSEAYRVGYSSCSKPVAVGGYLLQQMPERGRCFSSSMRQIPQAKAYSLYFFFSYLFTTEKHGPSQLYRNTLGQLFATMRVCVAAWKRTGRQPGNGAWCDPKSK